MVMERRLTDEPEEGGDYPEEEINPFWSAARLRASLDPNARADPREPASDS